MKDGKTWCRLLSRLLKIYGFKLHNENSSYQWIDKLSLSPFIWSLVIEDCNGNNMSLLHHHFVDENEAKRLLINESEIDDSLKLICSNETIVLLDKRPRCLEELKIKLDLMDDGD